LGVNKDELRLVRLWRNVDGTEAWLDTEPGRQLTGVVERQEAPAPPGLIGMAAHVLEEVQVGWHLRSMRHACCPVRAPRAPARKGSDL
jgi:hypothetical protein